MKLRISAILTLALLSLPITAMAQNIARSDELQTAVNSVSESVAQEDSTKDTLLKIFSLTQAEINDILTKDRLIPAITDKDSAIALLAKSHVNTLKGYITYISTLEKQASDETTSAEDIKLMASDFKTWREQYDAEIKETLNLILFLQARAVLGTANSRLTLIAVDVKKLNVVASKTDIDSLNKLMATAKKNLQGAKVNQDTARTALLESDPDKKISASEIFEKNMQDEFAKIYTTYSKVFSAMSKIAQNY